MTNKQKNIKNSEIKNNKRNNKRNNRNIKKKKFKKSIVLLVILVVLLVVTGIFAYRVQQNGGGFGGVLKTVIGHDEETLKDLPEFKCLILGISTDQEDVYLTDTIMVASYNPNTQKASLLSIPRDTYVGNYPSSAVPYDKINSYYSRQNRPEETLEAVNQLTGLEIENYVVVQTEALIELVDAIGGVTFDVPIDMYYTDTSQDLFINLSAGEQVLNGDQAEQLVRFRKNNDGTSYPEEYGDNDTGRMRTQREFIEAVIVQALKPENIFKIDQIISIIEENIITNVEYDKVKDYIPYAVDFNVENIVTGTLPGENTNKTSSGTWIYKVDESEAEKLITDMFITRDLVETETAEPTDNIQIEILNASGSSSALKTVTERLETAGYNIVREGTTNVTSKTTIVSSKELGETTATNIENMVGVGEIIVDEEQDSQETTVDIVIVLGKDYTN